MAGKLSPAASAKLSELEALGSRVARCHSLVEQFAASRGQMDAIPMKRAFGELKRAMMGAGFDPIAQLAGAMEIAAGRGASPGVKTRILREGMGSIRFQLELEQRAIIQEGQKKPEPDHPDE